MKASDLVLIFLGVHGLGTPQVLVIDTLILGIEFPNDGVPLHSSVIVIYNIAEL